MKIEITSVICDYDEFINSFKDFAWCDKVEEPPVVVTINDKCCETALRYFRENKFSFTEIREASIKCYQNNADIFYGDDTFSIDWDGLSAEELSDEEYDEWIEEKLKPIENATNYDDIRRKLEIQTDYLRK